MKMLLADDHPLIRSGLRGELATLDANVEFVEAWDAESLYAMLDRHADLELAIVDLSMPGMDGAATIAKVRCDHPSIPIVVLSGGDPSADAKAVLRAGAAGFIPKTGMSKVMLQAIRLVLAGGQYLPPQVMLDATERPVDPPSPAQPTSTDNGHALARLSERQRQVFALLAAGLSNKAIARRLDITEGTVKTHVATIFDVFNVHNRVAAVAAARVWAAVPERAGRGKGSR